VLMDWVMPGMDGLEASKRIKEEKKIKTPIIIMVTAFWREEIAKQAQEIGINGFLVKPITHSFLFDTIIGIFGNQKKTIQNISEEYTKYTDELKKIKGANILLTEDNEINQQVAQELLTDVGFIVEIANDGKESVEMITSSGIPSKYDLVLMDLQMPVMDGFNATIEIRKRKEFDNLPIIAMTADAIVGVKEKCIEIGMQDFISKPIDPDYVFATLTNWIKPRELQNANNNNNITNIENKKEIEVQIPEIPGLNIHKPLQRMGNKKKLYLSILKKFYANNQKFCFELRKSVIEKDFETAYRQIHTLKGVSGSIGADTIHAKSIIVEQSIIDKDISKFETEIAIFEKELSELFNHISSKLEFETQTKNHSLNKELVKKIIPKLKQLLQEKNPKAKNLLKDLNAAGLSGDSFDELKNKITKYDFKNAILCLNKIEKHI